MRNSSCKHCLLEARIEPPLPSDSGFFILDFPDDIKRISSLHYRMKAFNAVSPHLSGSSPPKRPQITPSFTVSQIPSGYRSPPSPFPPCAHIGANFSAPSFAVPQIPSPNHSCVSTSLIHFRLGYPYPLCAFLPFGLGITHPQPLIGQSQPPIHGQRSGTFTQPLMQKCKCSASTHPSRCAWMNKKAVSARRP